MPTPSGLKISELPSGVIPASGSDLLVLVQNGNTVQVPVSGVRRNTTAELPESGNLYYTNARARAALAAGEGLVYTESIGTFTLDPSYISSIATVNNASITGVSVTSINNGRQKTIRMFKKDGSSIYASWIDQGQDISIAAQQGLEVNVSNGIWNISNSDRGSSQNIFKTVSVSGSQSLIANSNTDYITIIPGSNIGITSNSGNRTITISATGTSSPVTGIVAGTGISVSRVSGEVTVNNSDRGSSQNIFKTVAVSGLTSIAATGNSDTLTFVAGSNINFSTDPATNKLVINAVSGAGLVGNVTSVNGLSGTVVLTTDNIGEGSNNLYFTTARARSSITAGNGISISNGLITNTSPLSSGLMYKRVVVSNNGSPTWLDATSYNDYFTIIAGSGISLSGNSVTRTMTINASGNGGGGGSAGGPYTSVQFNRLGTNSGVSSFYYNINDSTLYKTDGNITIGATGDGHISNTGIRIIAGTEQSGAMQTWENNSGVVQSQITSSGAFRGAVTPNIVSTDIDLEVDNSYNGKVVEFLRTGSTDAVLTLGTGITIPNWNMKVLSINSAQRVQIQASGKSLLYPQDRYPRTRKGYSVVDILRRNNGDFILYGDLDDTEDTIGGMLPPVGGGGGGGGSSIGECNSANNASIVENLTYTSSMPVSQVYNNTSIIPYSGTYPKVVNGSTALLNAWGSQSFTLALNSAQIEIKPPANYGCYDYIGVIDQYGDAIEFNKTNPPYLLNLYTTGVIDPATYKNSGVYEEVSFNIITTKAGSATSITTPITVSMVTNRQLAPNINANIAYYWTPKYGINLDRPGMTDTTLADQTSVDNWIPYSKLDANAQLRPYSSSNKAKIRTGNNGVHGAPYIEFDGSGSAMTVPLSMNSHYLIAMAARFRDSAHAKYHSLFAVNSGSNGIYKGYGGDNPGLIAFKSPAGNATDSPLGTGVWGVYMYGYSNGAYTTLTPTYSDNGYGYCTISNPSSEVLNIYSSAHGNTNSTTKLTGSSASSVNNNLDFLSIGYDPSRANSYFKGDIGEIFIIRMPAPSGWSLQQGKTYPSNCAAGFSQGVSGKAYDSTLISNLYNYLSFWTT